MPTALFQISGELRHVCIVLLSFKYISMYTYIRNKKKNLHWSEDLKIKSWMDFDENREILEKIQRNRKAHWEIPDFWKASPCVSLLLIHI